MSSQARAASDNLQVRHRTESVFYRGSFTTLLVSTKFHQAECAGAVRLARRPVNCLKVRPRCTLALADPTALLAFVHVVSRLDRTHVALIEVIVNLPWMTTDSSPVKTYSSEILVSARLEYLSLVLGRIALDFTNRTPPDHGALPRDG